MNYNEYDRKKVVNPGALSTCVLNWWWMMMGTTKQPAYSPTITNRSPLPVKAQGGLVRVVLHLFHQIGRLSVRRGGLPSRQHNEGGLCCCSSGCSGASRGGLLTSIEHTNLIFTAMAMAWRQGHDWELSRSSTMSTPILFESINLSGSLAGGRKMWTWLPSGWRLTRCDIR